MWASVPLLTAAASSATAGIVVALETGGGAALGVAGTTRPDGGLVVFALNVDFLALSLYFGAFGFFSGMVVPLASGPDLSGTKMGALDELERELWGRLVQ